MGGRTLKEVMGDGRHKRKAKQGGAAHSSEKQRNYASEQARQLASNKPAGNRHKVHLRCDISITQLIPPSPLDARTFEHKHEGVCLAV